MHHISSFSPKQITKGGSTLRYLGSPYQTSLSEAGQDKYFYCVQRGHHESHESFSDGVDATAVTEGLETTAGGEKMETWKEIERWTVSIGAKIIKVRKLCPLLFSLVPLCPVLNLRPNY